MPKELLGYLFDIDGNFIGDCGTDKRAKKSTVSVTRGQSKSGCSPWRYLVILVVRRVELPIKQNLMTLIGIIFRLKEKDEDDMNRN